MRETLPYLDLADPGFSTRSDAVRAARDRSWCARTPFGLAVLRHRQAGMLLRDRRLRQGSYAWPARMGLTGSFAAFWSRSVISEEGASHKRLRQLAMPSLTAEAVAGMVPAFEAIADDLICARLGDTDRIEFMADIATPFAGRAITTLLDLPEADWPEVAGDASALGLAMGLDCKRHEATFNAACTRLMDRAEALIRRAETAPARTDYASALVARAAAMGDVSRDALRDLIVISIFGGVDTTRAQLGFLADAFARHPDQWAALRRDPALASAAVEESIRLRPTTTWSTREATEDLTVDGVSIRKGETVHILAHATATDPAVRDHDAFDITQPRRKIHFGFGGGAHHCLGQAMARADIAAAIRVLARRVATIATDGSSESLPETGNTSFVTLPLRLVARSA